MPEPTSGPVAGLVIAAVFWVALIAVIAHTYIQDRKDRHQ